MGKKTKGRCSGHQHAAQLEADRKRRRFKAQEAEEARKRKQGK